MFMPAWGDLKFCFLNFVQQRGTVRRFEAQAVININVGGNFADRADEIFNYDIFGTVDFND